MAANSMSGSIATTNTTARTNDDTIVAIATPPGRGGIGIVRLSGPDAGCLLSSHLELRSSLLPGRARYCAIVDHGARLDEGVVTWFAAPRASSAASRAGSGPRRPNGRSSIALQFYLSFAFAFAFAFACA